MGLRCRNDPGVEARVARGDLAVLWCDDGKVQSSSAMHASYWILATTLLVIIHLAR